MHQRIVWFALLVVAVLLSAGSAQATTIGYLRPSGDGEVCTAGDTNPCVNVVGSTLEIGNGTSITDFQIVEVDGITSGTEVDFTFAGTAPTSGFGVIACAYESNFGVAASPGIYDSSGNLVSTSCTQLGDNNCPDPFNAACSTNQPFNGSFVTDLNCSITDTICLSFSGTGLPSSWFFGEDVSTTTCTTDPDTLQVTCQTATDGPAVTLVTETAGSVITPEPASMTLLAAGLLGLGAWRRKRAA